METALVIIGIVVVLGTAAVLLGAHLGEALGNSLFLQVESDAPPTVVVEAAY
jgi:hypothetical protein